ncbi:hypothetical protein Nhal_0973 [Nitrosococcus halophilus Nc 4]|uniref:Uncharacterized protein n=1 Tax=Nitrosococcus halophilus (strain Nc4) TaxID=472759 RepID=D5BYG3_NITHN|nr:hypothetical protein [Nitrosococcus halophilus]ADE14146.1 hypothetical protein Nhal_0973 [Nitrosococcus halophilus Nc 4]
MTVSCQHCLHAKPWFVHGGISVECLAKGERGYAWDIERQCGQFERKPSDSPGKSHARIKAHGWGG